MRNNHEEKFRIVRLALLPLGISIIKLTHFLQTAILHLGWRLLLLRRYLPAVLQPTSSGQSSRNRRRKTSLRESRCRSIVLLALTHRPIQMDWTGYALFTISLTLFCMGLTWGKNPCSFSLCSSSFAPRN